MQQNVQYRKNTLFINNRPLNFDYTIGNAFSVNNKILFMLEIPPQDETLRNIYCLSSDCQFLWQVQSPLEAYPEIGQEIPFTNLAIRENGTVTASDFLGRNFDIDENTGKLINFKVAR